jgi:hypothetical protein
MTISITTDGGFTGRGIGSVRIEHVDDELSRILETCDVAAWRDDYRSPGADLVRYTLTMNGTSVSWTEGARIPEDLRRLFEAVWRRRST